MFLSYYIVRNILINSFGGLIKEYSKSGQGVKRSGVSDGGGEARDTLIMHLLQAYMGFKDGGEAALPEEMAADDPKESRVISLIVPKTNQILTSYIILFFP